MGTLKVDGHIEGNYIKATWLYTSAATAKTSVDKIACIGSDNFIYYITPANMSVGYASTAPWSGISGIPNLVHKRDQGYAYSALDSYYCGGSTPTYYRVTLPDVQLNIWSMVTIELLIKQKYDAGTGGKIIINAYHSTGNWLGFTAFVDGYLTSDIKVYASDQKYFYIAGCSPWSTIHLSKMLVSDRAVSTDLTNTSLDFVTALPSTYQTASMIYGLTSNNYTSYTVTKTGSGASGTWGINITGNAGSATYLKDKSTSTATYVNYGASGITSTSWMAAWNGYELRAMSPDYVCASRLYSTDSSYKYSSGNPYYGYLTYSSPYWDFKVYPASPADVRVSRAYTAGSADSANWASGASYAQRVAGTYTGNGGAQGPSYIGRGNVKFNMMDQFPNAGTTNYMDCILMNTYGGGDIPRATAFGIERYTGRAWIAEGSDTSSTWEQVYEVISTRNIASQSVSYATRADKLSALIIDDNLAYNAIGTDSGGGPTYEKALLSTLCSRYPGYAGNFAGRYWPNSYGLLLGNIYSTSTVSNGLPQYSTFLACNLQDTPRIFGTCNYNQYSYRILTENNYSWWCVPLSGGTMSGNLAINTNGNTMTIGSLNSAWCHFQSSADIPFYFNRRVFVDGCLGIYQMNSQGCGSSFPSSPTTGQIFFKI